MITQKLRQLAHPILLLGQTSKFIPEFMRHSVLSLLLPGLYCPAHADIIYLQQSASGPNKIITWTSLYKGRQNACTHAAAGDEIWVALGK